MTVEILGLTVLWVLRRLGGGYVGLRVPESEGSGLASDDVGT